MRRIIYANGRKKAKRVDQNARNEQEAEIRMYLQKIDNNSDSENQTMTDIMEK